MPGMSGILASVFQSCRFGLGENQPEGFRSTHSMRECGIDVCTNPREQKRQWFPSPRQLAPLEVMVCQVRKGQSVSMFHPCYPTA
jgi:hypothetical protein